MADFNDVVSALQDRSEPLLDDPERFDRIVDEVKDAKIVMLGEATHGTADFYFIRRKITEELVQNHGFRVIAVEGDWPDCEEANRYIQGEGDPSSEHALQAFQRWPSWMWANTEIARLLENLRAFNAKRSLEEKARFYGLDVYSLFESIDSILRTVRGSDPDFARRLATRYSCFDPYERDEIRYAMSLHEFPAGCTQEILDNLFDLMVSRLDLVGVSEPSLFDLRQNARVIKNAERYYRAMVTGDAESWNIRDRHMLETLELLLQRPGADGKAIVWAHNTHIGDYRATDMQAAGYVNIGGLAREKLGEDAVRLIGFGTFRGTVVAGRSWGAAHEVMEVPEARPESLESALRVAAARKDAAGLYLPLREGRSEAPLDEVIGHRAIGVVYDPRYERRSNYVPTVLSRRYDGFVFVTNSSAVRPLPTRPEAHRFPETWPSGQ